MAPPRPATLLLLALLPGLVAGCLTAAPPAQPEPGPAGPAVYPFTMRGCQASIAVVGVPQERVAPHIPEGWRSLSMAQIGLGAAPNPRAEANLGLEIFVCEEVDGLNATFAEAAYGSVWTMVEPPAEHRRDDVDFHFIKWDVAIADPDVRGRLRAAGVPALSAEAAWDEFMLLPGGASRYAGRIAFEGGWGFTLEGEAAAPFPPTGAVVEFTPIPAGLAVWSNDYAWSPIAIGPVRVQLQGPSLAADILGGSSAEGLAFAGVIRFDNGNVTVPPAAR